MRRVLCLIAALALSGLTGEAGVGATEEVEGRAKQTDVIPLPPPRLKGAMSLEEALAARRSDRELSGEALSTAELSQLFWAAQGITGAGGFRTAPSAGALYPLELYVATAGGLFHYEPRGHRLLRLSTADPRPALRRAALDQAPVGEAPAVVVIAARVARTEAKYGPARSPRYVHLEAGHAAQNLLLMAVALGRAGVPVGAFDDARVRHTLSLPEGEGPLYLIPIGTVR
jgi:SagB-type dehydrogenase family enzyme